MVACLDLTQDPPIVCEVEERRRVRKVKGVKEPKMKKERKVREEKEKKVKRPPVEKAECSVCCTIKYVHAIDGKFYCYFCNRLRNATEEMREFVMNAYNQPCTFCGVPDGVKHFDHINMFEKRASVMDLVDGSLEEFKEEMAKCQLLCVPCHRLVTSTEHKMGFVKKKKQLAKIVKNVELRRAELVAEYAVAMAPFYEKMRGRVPCVENKGDGT
jgi:hypothetical protein